MKKLIKLTSMIALLAITLTGCGMAENPTAASVNKQVTSPVVKLIHSRATARYDYAGPGYGKLTGYVEVENLAYNKEITILYYVRQTGEWHETKASYVCPTWGGKEAWYFETPEYSFSARLSLEFQFAVKYTVNGKEYWDNNDKNDYKVSVGARPIYSDFAMGSAKVFLFNAQSYRWHKDGNEIVSLMGKIALEDLGYDKTVKLVYTTDNWTTVNEAAASYAGPAASGGEYWNFNIELPASVQDIQFAIAYIVGGATYWDNNFLRNFKITAPGRIN